MCEKARRGGQDRYSVTSDPRRRTTERNRAEFNAAIKQPGHLASALLVDIGRELLARFVEDSNRVRVIWVVGLTHEPDNGARGEVPSTTTGLVVGDSAQIRDVDAYLRQSSIRRADEQSGRIFTEPEKGPAARVPVRR
jgi:hypothetical protein